VGAGRDYEVGDWIARDGRPAIVVSKTKRFPLGPGEYFVWFYGLMNKNGSGNWIRGFTTSENTKPVPYTPTDEEFAEYLTWMLENR
jgi:hypothetical protein